MVNPKISRATLGRAPAYLKFLRGIEDSTANISATTIAKELELGEVQVRKDLRALCGSGKPKTGYRVDELTASLAAFDIAVSEPVSTPNGKLIYPLSELGGFCKEQNARIGIIAVPAEAAQQACNELYAAGIKMMLCLAPCKIIPPSDAIVRYENIAQSLAALKAQSL